MKLKIDKLKIETTLEDFINAWGLNINEVKKELEGGYYSDDFISIKENKKNWNVDLDLARSYEIIDMVNNSYNNKFILIVKDIWNGQTDKCENCIGFGEIYNKKCQKYDECQKCNGTGGEDEIEYTSFTLESGCIENLQDIIFMGGESDKKKFLSSKQLKCFNKLEEDGLINFTDLLDCQEFYFVKKTDIQKDGWKKTLKSFNLYNWETYPYN